MTAGQPRFAAAILGWHGARERHLGAIARHYASLGGQPIVHLPRAFAAMARPGGWERQAEALAARLPAELPLLVHAFSNAGFWTAAALLARLPEGRLAGAALDSAPGFPERVGPLFTARYATRAMLPALLERLGRPPRHRHPLLSPPLALFFAGWHLIAREQVRFMERSQASLRGHLRGRPLLAIWGGADELVPPEHVARFVDAAERQGARVERLYLPEGEHVRHLVLARRAYLEASARLAARALGP